MCGSQVEGEGKRASRVQATAKRAGIKAKGYQLPFTLTQQRTRRPLPPTNVSLT